MSTHGFQGLVICRDAELISHRHRAFTHVISMVDPDADEPKELETLTGHCRLELRFRDTINERRHDRPKRDDLVEILRFGETCFEATMEDRFLLIHDSEARSRSTAAFLAIVAQAFPLTPEDELFRRLEIYLPGAWPNSLMVRSIDEILGRKGRLTAALHRHYARALLLYPSYEDHWKALGRKKDLEDAKRAGWKPSS